jgi:NitT/TauT family transport system ATP-binding protein
MSQIVFDHVRHGYRVPGKPEMLALSDISLSVAQGEFVSLLGPSGCGKSTLLYLLGGFVPLQSGQILMEGRPVTGPGPDRGVVFQNFALFPWKTVRQNIAYGLERRSMPARERAEIVQDFIDKVHLRGFEDSFPSQLSGGMRQRVAIARTLAVKPKVLLMDEPFGALDAQTREIMHEELLGLMRATPMTTIFVTHDVREAVYLSNRVAVMSSRPGRIKEVVSIDLPPREGPAVMKSAAAGDYVEYLWSQVKTDAAHAVEAVR